MSVASSITTGVGIAGGLIVSTSTMLNDDGTINKDNGKSALITSVCTTGSLVAATIVNNHDAKVIEEQYKKSYIDSLSDEELEKALIQIGELTAGSNQDSVNKTI